MTVLFMTSRALFPLREHLMTIMKYLMTAVFLLASITGTQAFAHKVNLFAYAEGDEIYVEGYFVDGKAAQNSKIQVLGPDGKIVHEGTTDDQGQYRFPIPQHTDLKIIVNAGMGHQSDFILPVAELSASEAHSVKQPKQPEPVSINADDGVQKSAVEVVENGDLDSIVRKAVNEAIKPLVRELSASQQKASLTGIVGGVGYIVGVLGLFAFFKSRQTSSGTNKPEE